MAKKTAGTETDNAAAVGAAEAAQIDRFNATGEIGKDKAVPPQTGTTAGAAARLLPRERSAQPGNILDFDRNEKYQLDQLFPDGDTSGWRGWWVFAEAHHPVPHDPQALLVKVI